MKRLAHRIGKRLLVDEVFLDDLADGLDGIDLAGELSDSDEDCDDCDQPKKDEELDSQGRKRRAQDSTPLNTGRLRKRQDTVKRGAASGNQGTSLDGDRTATANGQLTGMTAARRETQEGDGHSGLD
jgi:hypothetical protein